MASEGVLIAVDPYPRGRLGFSAQRFIAQRELNKIPNGVVRWIRSTGVEAPSDCAIETGAVDFLFIDAEHTYEGLRGDWEAWSPFVASGGIVALHDSCSSQTRQIDEAGSVIYTNEVIRRDPRFGLVEIVDTLTILRRIENNMPLVEQTG
jgi:hypothetical protein